MATSTRFYYGQKDYIEQMNEMDDAINAAGLANALTTNTAQTVTAAKTFQDGTLKVAGSTSGAVTVHAPAVAGASSVTLPSSGGTLLSANDLVGDPSINVASAPASATAANTLYNTKADVSALKTLIPGNSFSITADGTGLVLTLDTIQPLRTTDSPTFASLVGSTTGVAKGAGKIGERVKFQNLGVAMSATNSPQTIVSAVLQPGDWEVYGLLVFNAGSGTLTYLGGGLNTTTNVLPADPGVAVDVRNATSPSVNPKLLVPSTQICVNAVTTVYLVAQAAFGTSLTVDGYVWARRW
jgi:hypothetical protein